MPPWWLPRNPPFLLPRHRPRAHRSFLAAAVVAHFLLRPSSLFASAVCVSFPFLSDHLQPFTTATTRSCRDMPARPFLRTSSKCQLIPSSVYENRYPPVAEGRGRPQHVVIGFHLSEERKHGLDACDSPRSVLETSAHSEQARSPKSPRSVLGCLISGKESHRPFNQGVGLGVAVAIRAEEARVRKSPPEVAMRSKPIVILGQNQKVDACNRTLRVGEDACTFYSEDMRVNEFADFEVDDPMTGMQESIFCAASPFSACCSLEKLTCDFLSVCFLCKCHLSHGKDVYMYKGDKAFCSSECRYQQIIIDEFKEKQLATANCCAGASTKDFKVSAQASATKV